MTASSFDLALDQAFNEVPCTVAKSNTLATALPSLDANPLFAWPTRPSQPIVRRDSHKSRFHR
ncbi:hypothetical protein DBV39_10275 [Orrella marina]|uniref:Uncharacterized protein n=1 Tax=Orrella marina TaxID=2163011 RepID=A0A2R4XJS5_9BURK|nr:hypothetical protein DBV39_10275 [Orrella marina]